MYKYLIIWQYGAGVCQWPYFTLADVVREMGVATGEFIIYRWSKRATTWVPVSNASTRRLAKGG